MKKILPLIVVGIFVLSGLSAVAISESENEYHELETLTFAQPISSDLGDFLSISLMEANANSIEVGKPSLPTVSKVFTYPLGTKISNVEVTFSNKVGVSLPKKIKPAPEPQIVSSIHSTKSVIKSKNVDLYNDIDIYPESRFSFKTGAGLKDVSRVIYLTVYLHPIQYVPSENMIYYSESANIDVEYVLPENPVNFPDVYDLLIITPSEYTTQLQPLVDHKIDNGIETIMVTLDEIPSGVGVDEQEDIKYFIKDAIESWDIKYLILVGSGIEGEEQFPVRQAWIPSGNYEQFFPSDLYYADIYDSSMQFSNWDHDGDGRFAEYPEDMQNVDVYPDVYLGKLPCHTTSEVTAVVDKIIKYKAHNLMTNKIVQIGGDTFPGDPEHINEGEYANEAVLDNLPGYSTTRLWGSNNQLTKPNIANGFKDNVDFVDFSGHGSWAGWATHPPEDENTWLPPETTISPYDSFLYADFDLYLINNKYKFPVVVYNACSCNKYSEDINCIGWKTVRKPNSGGIAAFGASGIGYGSHGTSEIERVWGWMEVKIFYELYNTKLLGEVWANAINEYASSFELDDADYKTLLEMSMFSDPTVVIEDGDDPKSIPTNTPIMYRLIEFLAMHFPKIEKLLSLLIK